MDNEGFVVSSARATKVRSCIPYKLATWDQCSNNCTGKPGFKHLAFNLLVSLQPRADTTQNWIKYDRK